jgi:hypothetical protein
VTRPRTIVIDGKPHTWREIVALRKAQAERPKNEQPTLFELREDRRPPSDRTAAGALRPALPVRPPLTRGTTTMTAQTAIPYPPAIIRIAEAKRSAVNGQAPAGLDALIEEARRADAIVAAFWPVPGAGDPRDAGFQAACRLADAAAHRLPGHPAMCSSHEYLAQVDWTCDGRLYARAVYLIPANSDAKAIELATRRARASRDNDPERTSNVTILACRRRFPGRRCPGR